MFRLTKCTFHSSDSVCLLLFSLLSLLMIVDFDLLVTVLHPMATDCKLQPSKFVNKTASCVQCAVCEYVHFLCAIISHHQQSNRFICLPLSCR